MKDATHFIEVFKNIDRGIVKNSNTERIERLDSVLTLTKQLKSLKTIAVWKIKMK
jgi:hypothetical protein